MRSTPGNEGLTSFGAILGGFALAFLLLRLTGESEPHSGESESHFTGVHIWDQGHMDDFWWSKEHRGQYFREAGSPKEQNLMSVRKDAAAIHPRYSQYLEKRQMWNASPCQAMGKCAWVDTPTIPEEEETCASDDETSASAGEETSASTRGIAGGRNFRIRAAGIRGRKEESDDDRMAAPDSIQEEEARSPQVLQEDPTTQELVQEDSDSQKCLPLANRATLRPGSPPSPRCVIGGVVGGVWVDTK